MQCKKCGTIIKEGEKFCGNCGEVVTQVGGSLNVNSQSVNNPSVQNVHPTSVNTNQSTIQQQPTSVNVSQGIVSQQQTVSNVSQEATVERPTSDWIGDNNNNNNKNNKKKSNIGIVILLIIIILLLAGGIFYFLNKNESEQKNNKKDDSQLNNNANDNNDDDNNSNENIDFYTKLNESIYDNADKNDIELLKDYEVVDYNKEQLDLRNAVTYSDETYYETIFGNKAIKFEIINGELVFSEVELISDNNLTNGFITTEKHSFYDCDKVTCKSQKISLGGEKAKYLSISTEQIKAESFINVIVLTENNNIYEGTFMGNGCQALACPFDIKLTLVNSNYKFQKIAQLPVKAYANILSVFDNHKAINYGLTTDGKLLLVDNYEAKDISPIPLARDTYSSLNSKSYGYFTYENGAIQLANNSFVLKNEKNLLLATEMFEGTDNLYILGVDGYLYFVDASNYDENISNPLVAKKHSDKKVELIEYNLKNVYDGVEVKQLAVHQDPLYVNIKYVDGTMELFEIKPLQSTVFQQRRFMKILQKKEKF